MVFQASSISTRVCGGEGPRGEPTAPQWFAQARFGAVCTGLRATVAARATREKVRGRDDQDSRQILPLAAGAIACKAPTHSVSAPLAQAHAAPPGRGKGGKRGPAAHHRLLWRAHPMLVSS